MSSYEKEKDPSKGGGASWWQDGRKVLAVAIAAATLVAAWMSF